MLPIELVKTICEYLDTYNQMVCFISVSKYYFELRRMLDWNKGYIIVTREITNLPYYNQLKSIYFTGHAWCKIPVNVESLMIGKFTNNDFINIFLESNMPSLKNLKVSNISYNHAIPIFLEKYPTIETLNLSDMMCVDLFSESNAFIKSADNIHTLELYYIRVLNRNILPKNLKKLSIFSFIGVIESLPYLLEELEIKYNFDEYILKDTLPLTLKKLCLGKSYNKGINVGVLPQGLQEIVFGKNYDQIILYGSIPSTVKKITFGDSFNKPIVTLSEGIEQIKVGLGFNMGYLKQKGIPSSLKEIYIPENKCNDSIDNSNYRFKIINYMHPKMIGYKPHMNCNKINPAVQLTDRILSAMRSLPF